jgi:hypothetical protein
MNMNINLNIYDLKEFIKFYSWKYTNNKVFPFNKILLKYLYNLKQL